MIRTYVLTTLYVARCDVCGTQTRTAHDGHASREWAIKEAVLLGWSVTEDGELCRACSTEEPLSAEEIETLPEVCS